MKAGIITSYLLLALLVSCDEQQLVPLENDHNRLNYHKSSDCFVPEIDYHNIIKDIQKDRRNYRLILENDEEILIPEECLESYSINPDEWFVSLQYGDSLTVNLPYVGHSFTIDPDSIMLNPSGHAPLTAVIKFSTPVPRNIRMSVKKKTEDNARVSFTTKSPSIHHNIPVYGLFADHNNTVELSILDYSGNEITSRDVFIRTEPYDRVQSGEMIEIQNNYDVHQKDRLFLIQNAIYDAAGDVRWYVNHGGQKYYKLSKGLIAIQAFPDKAWIGEGPDLKIINLLGEIVDTFDVPNRLHHEVIEKTPGGNLLVATNAQEYQDIEDDTEDMIAELDRNTGQVVREWDLSDIFDPERERLWTENENDWCHLNSIQYDSTDNTLLISSKLQYFISKIDYETGEIKWILGNHENWKEKFHPYLLTPVNFDTSLDPDQDWPYAQHMPRLTGSGTIMVYDNGVERPQDDYSRAVEYKVDEENMTVELVWAYNLEEPARSLGSVQVYDDYSVQIGHGRKGLILEVSREKDILFYGKLKSFYRSYAISFY